MQAAFSSCCRGPIECLRLHDAETPDRFAAAIAPGGAIEAMIALKAEGKVKTN